MTDGKFIIVDVGAGTLHDCQSQIHSYLETRRERVILIYAPPEEVLPRNPLGPDRPIEQYQEMEYRSRERLYLLAGLKLDVTGLSKEGAVNRFLDPPQKTVCVAEHAS